MADLDRLEELLKQDGLAFLDAIWDAAPALIAKARRLEALEEAIRNLAAVIEKERAK